MKLIMAVAAQRVKDVARRALRMDEYDGRRAINIPKHKSKNTPRFILGLARRVQTFEAQQMKMSPTCWKADICDLS
jgi:hypothetical protein